MKITDALVQLKMLKEQISRLYNIRKENFKVYIPKELTLEDVKQDTKKHDIILFDDLTEKIETLESRITNLRERLVKTNVNTMVTLEGKEITLARLKLLLDDHRSRLSQLMGLSKGARFVYLSTSKGPRSIDDEEKEVFQLNDLEVERLITEEEERKNKLQVLLDTTNAMTDVIG